MRLFRRARQFGRKLTRALRAEVRAWLTRGPVRPGVVFYESFAGNGVLCNPEAIFRELLRRPDARHLTHVWALDRLRAHPEIRREFAGNARVRFVRRGTFAYFRALATSGFLVNNATFPPEFGKRSGQVYLNTWHGTPLKHMGYDMPDGALEAANTLRNFLSADFLLSQNPFMTEQMYATAYKLRGLFRGRILEAGYPRVDHQFLDAGASAAARARLEASGIPLGSRQIVLYAPTWSGDSFSSPDDNAQALIDATRRLQSLLGHDQYAVLLKTHQSVHAFAAHHPGNSGLLVPNDIPTNVMLGLSSLLVTDYSSIFFDFLAGEKPIVFYTPDAEQYTESRGTYVDASELPGPVRTTMEGVAAAILEHLRGEVDLTATLRYREWMRRFVPHSDGGAAARVVDAVFFDRGEGVSVVSIANDDREPILLHLGGMRSNGITSSALNLLASIDHERFDVSIIIARPRGGQQRANQALIDPRVRQFHRIGGMNGNKGPHLRRRASERGARGRAHLDSPSLVRLWDDEWRRCFGDAHFAAVADFSGYSPFWATLFLHSPAAIRSIWLHNDMAAEQHRIIRGRRRMARSLRAVFALYSQFDRLISVSESLSAINRDALAGAQGIDPTAFVAARNLVDESRVRTGLAVNLADMPELAPHPETGESREPAWFTQMQSGGRARWFVTVGRFSTEKNQSRLLRSFATVHAAHPDTRLVLVGYGPLRGELERVIGELGLAEVAFLAGPYGNPFPLLAAADCFVLSSTYEGQPMVLLEAAIAELPIVSVRFGSIADALDEGQIHVVDQTDEALAAGMLAYLADEVPPAQIDVAGYNAEAISEFVTAIGRSA